jgi:hypothetical protein
MDVPELEDYYFFVNRWFAKDEDDKQIIRELMPTDENGRQLVKLHGRIIKIRFYF